MNYEQMEIKRESEIKLADVDLKFLIDINDDAWLTKTSVVDILCKDGNYSFRTSFPEVFESKVLLSVGKKRIRSVINKGIEETVFHESILYRGMFEAVSINGFNNEKVANLVDSIFMDVIPCLRKYGQYPAPKISNDVVPSKWGAIREIATQMEQIARLGEEHDKRINELEWKTTVMDEEKSRDQREIEYLKTGQEELQNQISEFLGTPDHRTVRLRMMELGIKRQVIEKYKMQIGKLCKKYCSRCGISLPEKIVEGCFLVNQYPIDIIDEHLIKLNLYSK